MHLGKTPWLQECVGKKLLALMMDRKGREEGGAGRGRDQTPGKPHSDLLSPAKPHLLKFPEPSKRTPPAGEEVFKV
jgi:hypothetical protein